MADSKEEDRNYKLPKKAALVTVWSSRYVSWSK